MEEIQVTVIPRDNAKEATTHKTFKVVPTAVGIFLYKNEKKLKDKDFTHFFCFDTFRFEIGPITD